MSTYCLTIEHASSLVNELSALCNIEMEKLNSNHVRKYLTDNHLFLPECGNERKMEQFERDDGQPQVYQQMFKKSDHPDVALTYTWSTPFRELFMLVTKATSHTIDAVDATIWIDVLCVDQRADTMSKLNVGKIVYSNAPLHIVTSQACFTRAWCLSEILTRIEAGKSPQFMTDRQKNWNTVVNTNFELMYYVANIRFFDMMQATVVYDKQTIQRDILSVTKTSARFDSIIRAFVACSLLDIISQTPIDENPTFWHQIQHLSYFYQGAPLSDTKSDTEIRRFLNSNFPIHFGNYHQVTWQFNGPVPTDQLLTRTLPVFDEVKSNQEVGPWKSL